MSKIVVLAVGVCAPALMHAQVSTSTQATATSTSSVRIPSEYSVDGQARLEAMFKSAREEGLPQKPMADRMAEGRAKGASEAKVIAAVAKVHGNLEASHRAIEASGRHTTTNAEVAAGAAAMDRGATEAQVGVLAQHTPSDRSLVVAFDVLTNLAARGVPVDQALARITAKLDARATDDVVTGLVTAEAAGGLGQKANAGSSAGAANGRGGATATATTAVGATTGAVTGSVTGTVKGAVGTVRKP